MSGAISPLRKWVETRFNKVVSVTDSAYGAVGDWNGTTGTNDATAFNNAITAAGLGGLVLVPPPPGGNAYLWTAGVTCNNGASILGIGRPQIIISAANTVDALSFGYPASDSTPAPYLEGLAIFGNPNNSSLRGRDALRILGGIRLQVRDVHLDTIGRDGLHLESNNDFNYIECCTFINVMMRQCSRDAIHIETGNTATVNYCNQSTFIGCDVRGTSTGYALHEVNNDTTNNASMKISQTNFTNCEFDNGGSTAQDIVFFTTKTTGSSGTIENNLFISSTIERNDTITGYGINGASIASSTIVNTYCYSTIFFAPGMAALIHTPPVGVVINQ